MMMTQEMELICVKCASCGDDFWDWANGSNTICDMCENFEPLDFDDWED